LFFDGLCQPPRLGGRVGDLTRFIRPGLTESEVEELLALGTEAVEWVLPAFAARRGGLKGAQGKDMASDINTPSGQISIYEKPNAKPSRHMSPAL
jgi:hypothetical protein